MSSSMLTHFEIENVVDRYREALVRYEEAATAVESRIRRELRATAGRALLSARAKHPDEARRKLLRKRSAANPPTFAQLEQGMNRVITDLAGVRVIVYDPDDEERVFQLVCSKLAVVDGSKKRKYSEENRYRAHHVLVEIDASFDRPSILGTIVEVQVASIASHVFNEIEHDITYKDHGVVANRGVQDLLDEVQWASRLLDRTVHRLVQARRESIENTQELLSTPEELRRVLETRGRRALTGDFVRLFQLLNAALPRLTIASVDELGAVGALIDRGKTATDAEVEDVTAFALGLAEREPELGRIFRYIAKTWRGPRTELKRAMLKEQVDV